VVSLPELEDRFREAKGILKGDPTGALALLREIAFEAMKKAAPGWNPREEGLAEYSSRRRYPDFFHEMADRIESSWRFVIQADESQILGVLSSTAFLLEVVRRLESR